MYTRKHFNFVRTALMLFFALFVSSNAWADAPSEQIGNDGNQHTFEKDGSGNYLIQSVDDWNGLADVVAGGYTCSGKTFLMTANIGPITKTIGKQIGSNKTDRKRFAGRFDGGNHTLTVELNAVKGSDGSWYYYNQGYCAPFAYLTNATISNLHVVGTITTTGQFASGLVGSSGGGSGSTCTISNCQVSTTITSNHSSNGNASNHGGFIGVAEGPTTITNCLFDGEFVNDTGDFEHSGGFIGQSKNTTDFSNCIFKPISCVTSATSSQFANIIGGTCTIGSSNLYFTPFGSNQGTFALADDADNSNGLSKIGSDPVNVVLYGRTLKKDGKWNTLCLPFNVGDPAAEDDHHFDGTQLEGATVKELDVTGTYYDTDKQTGLANDGKLYLYFKTATSIEAGKPYIVKWDKADGYDSADPNTRDLKNPVFTGVSITSTTPSDEVSFTGGKFVGQYSPFTVANANEIIVIGSSNKIGYSANGSTLRAFRAHFDMPQTSAPIMNVVFNTEDGQTTAINTVNGSELKVNGEYYNLAGQRVAQPTKGLYIVNGKKMVVK